MSPKGKKIVVLLLAVAFSAATVWAIHEPGWTSILTALTSLATMIWASAQIVSRNGIKFTKDSDNSATEKMPENLPAGEWLTMPLADLLKKMAESNKLTKYQWEKRFSGLKGKRLKAHGAVSNVEDSFPDRPTIFINISVDSLKCSVYAIFNSNDDESFDFISKDDYVTVEGEIILLLQARHLSGPTSIALINCKLLEHRAGNDKKTERQDKDAHA